MSRKLISSGSEFESKIGYSRAVVDGGYVYVSGTTGYDYQVMRISENVVEQAEQCFKNIEAALKEAGSSIHDIVRITYILPNKKDFESCWPVCAKWLGSVHPAATMFEAGLLSDDMKIEIQVTARKSRDFTPLIMWCCLFAGIIALALFRPARIIDLWNRSAVNFDHLFIGSYLLWMAVELKVTIKDVSAEGKKTSDQATCQIYGLGQALTFLTALWFQPVWRAPNMAHLIGFGSFLLGGCYRLWAIRTLGQFYSHRVRTVAQQRIVASGPYRFTRHPAYAGMIIANAGISVYFFNWVTLSAFVFILLPAIVLRIVIEERTLYGIEGYAEFAEKRKRLFPAIW